MPGHRPAATTPGGRWMKIPRRRPLAGGPPDYAVWLVRNRTEDPRAFGIEATPGRTTSGATLAFTTTASRRPVSPRDSPDGPARRWHYKMTSRCLRPRSRPVNGELPPCAWHSWSGRSGCGRRDRRPPTRFQRLIHLVGDAHQPLRSAATTRKGATRAATVCDRQPSTRDDAK